MFHLAGKGPISRQVGQKMCHLTGERLLSGVMTEVRGDGGEKGERVSRAFFCPRKLFPLSRKELPQIIIMATHMSRQLLILPYFSLRTFLTECFSLPIMKLISKDDSVSDVSISGITISERTSPKCFIF